MAGVVKVGKGNFSMIILFHVPYFLLKFNLSHYLLVALYRKARQMLVIMIVSTKKVFRFYLIVQLLILVHQLLESFKN